MIEIPKQLKNEKFRFILLDKNSKKPLEKNWQLANNYKYNNEKLLKHLNENKNYGVVCGAGNLFVLDLDVKNSTSKDFESLKKLETFQILTGGGGLHLYFKCDKELNDFKNETLKIGELKIRQVQVVGPNCNYTNGITKYKILKDLPIFEFKLEKFKKFYEDIISKYKFQQYNISTKNNLEIPIGEKAGDTSRSGVDFQNLRMFVQSGLKDEEILEKMKKTSIRWNELNSSKQKWELNNARKSLDKFPIKKELTWKQKQYYKQFEEEPEEILLEKNSYTVEQLLKEEFKEPEYYLNKLIPKNSIILIGGKPGKFKTGFILNLLLSMTKGQSFLEYFTSTSNPKILYYELDGNGKRSIFWKIKYFINGNQYNLDIAKRFTFEETFYKDNLQRELEIIKDYDIIVLDSYRRFLKGDENDNKITNQFFVDFLKKAKEMGKTVIVLHHFKKERIDEVTDLDLIDSFRGSSDIVSQFDVCFAINKSDDVENIENKTTTFNVGLLTAKDRDDSVTKRFNFNVLKDEEQCKTILSFNGFDILKRKRTEDGIDEEILKVLEDKKEYSRKYILEKVNQKTEKSSRTIIRRLEELEEFGKIMKGKHGHYKLKSNAESETQDLL